LFIFRFNQIDGAGVDVQLVFDDIKGLREDLIQVEGGVGNSRDIS